MPHPIRDLTNEERPDAIWSHQNTHPAKMRWITDGTSNTILIAESRYSSWLTSLYSDIIEIGRCQDTETSCHVPLFQQHGKGNNVAYCDGSVRYLTADIERDVFRAMITREGGEIAR
jgi:prepilin-type processing-associated H-X9-DG protein